MIGIKRSDLRMENFEYWVGIFLLAIAIHYLVYIASVCNVTYLQYKYRYKKMFLDWAFLFFVFIILPYIIKINSYE
jgi:hypothetical protein